MMNSAPATPLLLDCSLSLINRTGAHFIAQELAHAFAPQVTVRRWRLLGRRLPSGLTRKVLGRLMLRELRHAPRVDLLRWPDPAGPIKRIFLDPLYVLCSRLEQSDVVLCHDIGPVSHPTLYDAVTTKLYTDAYARIARVQPGLVFVSQASREAFVQRYGARFRFLRVIPLYVREGAQVGDVAPVAEVPVRFFLTVGALERRKNQCVAIEGFAQSGLAAAGFGYVLCGARGDGSDALLELARRTPGVRVLGYVSDAQLRWLYRNAAAFVLPSLLEGFGMPALEAAQYGLIPILSRDSALSEAVGGHCLQVDPEAPAQIATAMRDAAALDEGRREALRSALISHAAGASRACFLGAWRELLQSEMRAPSSAPASPWVQQRSR